MRPKTDSKEISVDHVDISIHAITHSRDAHFDSLMERLKEKRVQKIAEPVLTGKEQGFNFTDDDFQYVLDLGWVVKIIRSKRQNFSAHFCFGFNAAGAAA